MVSGQWSVVRVRSAPDLALLATERVADRAAVVVAVVSRVALVVTMEAV